jgi:hypothetical protein
MVVRRLPAVHQESQPRGEGGGGSRDIGSAYSAPDALPLGGDAVATTFGRGAQRGIEHPFPPVNFLAHVQDQ